MANRKAPGRASLAAHRHDIAAIDFFAVPTLTFRLSPACDTPPPLPTTHPHRRHRPAHRDVGGSTDRPRVPGRDRPRLPAPRSRYHRRRRLPASGRAPGHSPGRHCTSRSLAQSLSASASSARFAANVSISSSCSASSTSDACFARTSRTTTSRASRCGRAIWTFPAPDPRGARVEPRAGDTKTHSQRAVDMSRDLIEVNPRPADYE